MKLRERYKRLSLWSKLAAWGSFASLLGIPLALVLFLSSRPGPSTATAAVEANDALPGLAAQLTKLSDEVAGLRSQLSSSQQDNERLRNELQQKTTALDTSLQNLLSALQEQRALLTFDADALERSAKNTGSAARAVDLATRTAEGSSDQALVAEVQAEVERLESELNSARRYALSGDADSLRDLLALLRTEEFRAGTIFHRGEAKLYGPDERDRFLGDLAKEASKGSVVSLRRGTWTADGQCKGAPRDCGEATVLSALSESELFAQTRINWHLGPPERMAEERFSRLTTAQLDRLLARAHGSPCQLYRSLAASETLNKLNRVAS